MPQVQNSISHIKERQERDNFDNDDYVRIREYYYYTEGTNRNWVEFLYKILAPIFLVISLPYQFVRWYWEGRKQK